MAKILISTGALLGRANNRDYNLLKRFAKELHCDGYEFMMMPDWYDRIELVADFLVGNNIHTPVIHCEKHIGELLALGKSDSLGEALDKFTVNMRLAKLIGAGRAVIHLWNGRISDLHFSNNLSAYRYLREISDEFGVDLLVENVVCLERDPLYRWEELMAIYPDIHFVYDTKMAAFHCQDELIYDADRRRLWRNGHIKHLHVNDYKGGYKEWEALRTLPVGSGNVNWKRFFDHIREMGYDETFTIEATALDAEGNVDLAMLNRCVEDVRGFLV